MILGFLIALWSFVIEIFIGGGGVSKLNVGEEVSSSNQKSKPTGCVSAVQILATLLI
ncbi:predicted protein [Sclerotinia sclerotiorum 1980 UF-70]|uniref:Uncharacterized protein n=1 Tax=Sclerotinia sclerotiorum (strain ATCC 18683 / 1980 / Ss-1) TaxID=665079 RepID=A7EQS5_SCLS1|nr:predicted protein [Sclerotinia sclerotiorum 1980 UF-70]EDN91817.1 predicted protein [Sclerotinia sclerotiorum 1980 UF-70]